MKNAQLDVNLYNQLLIYLTEHSSEAFIIIDRDLNILFLNQEAQNIFHCRNKNFSNINFSEFCLNLNIDPFLQNVQMDILKKASVEITTLIHDLPITWVINNFIINKKQFYLIKSIGFERKSYEEKIYQLQTLIENTPCNVYWVNNDLRMIDCNQNVLNMLNMTREEFKGKSYEELSIICNWPPELAGKLKSDDFSVIKSGKPIIGKEDPPIPHADGSFSQFLTSRVPLRNQKGKIVGIAGISMDIAALKEAKLKAETANQAKTEFLENMRHDIRTPLTGIVGFADILKMEANHPQIQEYADNIVASSHALLELLNEVLEAIRVSSGEIPKFKKKFDLRKNLEHIIELYRSLAAQKKIDISLHFSPDIPAYVIGDKIRIHRIALELVGNALNFTDTGYVKLTASLENKDKKELVINLSVEDTGIGIPKDKQHEIYVQFKRLTPSFQGIYKGAGLGLSMVKQFIDEIDAEIYVESEPQKGTIFTCFIPLQEPLVDSHHGIDDEHDSETERHYQTTYAQQIKPPIPDADSKEYRVLVVRR